MIIKENVTAVAGQTLMTPMISLLLKHWQKRDRRFTVLKSETI